MKIDLKKSTLCTSVIVTLYAVYRIIAKCFSWAGAPIMVGHPIRVQIVNDGIAMLVSLAVASFLFALWKNRDRLPVLSSKWKQGRNILVLALAYVSIFQMQIIYHYPMYAYPIFMYLLWLCPAVYAGALWMYFGQLDTKETYTLSNTRALLLLLTSILLIVGVIAGVVLYVLWYNDTTLWLDRWHHRIPMIISVTSKIVLIFFLCIKNK
jgi:hypothetical protein